ncbi:LPXTG cell wall anchor domain-containing protein [Spiroplasma endosymbiont of 'Nebria riversi']|uniref:LPXTG cell wall anchor domain-containing protein n=1 Tax=Spiroplasma endosymbiont of 'Nebria riversi' TaxID=2792084 RepID=UPI001C05EAD7|nr:LPXTG cell wall anchor domain-containing protein [Spiroplasma endosymbiont of 'Nebria riversi']
MLNRNDLNESNDIYELGKKRLDQSNNRIITLKQDINATRIYYGSFLEIMARLILILSQVLFIVTIFLNAINYAKWFLDFNSEVTITIRMIIISIIFIFSTIMALLSSLFFIIPLLVCKTIASIKSWLIVFILTGSIIFSLVFAFSIYLRNYSLGTNNSIILSIVGFILLISGAILLLRKVKNMSRGLEKAIIESYFL